MTTPIALGLIGVGIMFAYNSAILGPLGALPSLFTKIVPLAAALGIPFAKHLAPVAEMIEAMGLGGGQYTPQTKNTPQTSSTTQDHNHTTININTPTLPLPLPLLLWFLLLLAPAPADHPTKFKAPRKEKTGHHHHDSYPTKFKAPTESGNFGISAIVGTAVGAVSTMGLVMLSGFKSLGAGKAVAAVGGVGKLMKLASPVGFVALVGTVGWELLSLKTPWWK